MANQDQESKSDGLEIISIGSIYNGAWDKKYWSSSRGKDRYPYPVGYQALRTHKGITYKMDINEGSKGPVFQITSNDRHSASGETPDRAWETFQKKCSRIKRWHGKRFSGKMDGVEFFGFKNSLVQRLLRELVASVHDVSERCSPVRNSEASVEGQNMACILSNKHPDLVPYVRKSRITGKRRRSSRSDKTQICLPQNHIYDASVLCASPKTPKTDVDISQVGEDLPVFSNLEHGIEVAPSAADLPLKCHESSSNSKTAPCLAQVERELPSTGACTSTSFNCNSLQEEKSLDRLHIEVGERGFQSTAEHGNEKAPAICDFPNSQAPVSEDSQVNHFENLCAPDTLDTQQEITCHPDSGKYVDDHSASKNELMASKLVMPREPSIESQLNEDTSNSNENSERSDYDLQNEEIVNKMLAVLLPQVAPLLTYSSRKKRRRSNKKNAASDVKPENESRGITDVMSPAEACGSSGVKEQLKTDAPFTNSTVFLSERSGYVPDSLDNDQCEDHITDQLLCPSNNAETVATDMHKVNHVSHRRVPQVANSTIETCSCPDQTNGTSLISPVAKTNNCEEILSPKEIPRAVDKSLNEDGIEALPSKVECSLNTYDSSKPLDSCYKKTKFEGAFGVEINAGKQHSISEDTVPNLGSVVVLSNYTAPLSESIICRNVENHHVCDSHPEAADMIVPDSFQVVSVVDGDSRKASFGVEGNCEDQISAMLNENAIEALTQKHNHSAARGLASSCDIIKDTIGNQNCDSARFSADHKSDCFPKHDVNEADSHESHLTSNKHNGGIGKTMKLIGQYSHPKRISSILLSRKSNEMYLCVSCGLIEERARDLLLYKLETKECNLGRPYMVGHSIMDLPVLKDEFGREVAIDNLGMQFTPDAGGLIVADSIRMPYCREKNIHCSCSECKSYCFEENAIKIVQIKLGYVSLVLKLNTIHPVHCLLVFEPQHLIALDESGRIYIWVMSSTWRVESEAYVIPSYDLLTSRVAELKRLPKSASMIVGHNGYGEFSLWDIINRTVVSRFSAPASSVLEFLPISLFNWQKNSLSHDKLVVDECVKNLVETTMLWLSEHDEANSSCPKGEDIAVWLFIRTSSNAGYLSSHRLNLDGYWRLGLLINNVVVLGPVVHPSTAAVSTSAGHGIIGTCDGQVYVWELATGTKLGTMFDFEGCGVSHIATDHSTSSAVAIGGDGGKLCVYLRS